MAYTQKENEELSERKLRNERGGTEEEGWKWKKGNERREMSTGG